MNYPRERKFRSYYGHSSRLIDVVRPFREVHVRRDFKYDRWANNHDTVFREAEVVPHYETQRSFLNALDKEESAGAKRPDLRSFAEGYMDRLVYAMEDTWKPDKIHLVATSSGFDSRCITMAILRLVEMHGPDWLGKVIFFEAAGEHEPFIQLMEKQGWNKDQYLVCYGGKSTEYHDFSFDFSRAWQRLNGFISYPVNVWYTPIEWMQEQGIIPNDDSQIQCFTMYGANETTRANKHHHQTLDFYFWWHYYHMLSAFPLKGEWVHPCYHPSVLKYLQVNRDYLANISDALSVCSVVAPLLFPQFQDIKKMSTKDVKLLGYLDPSRRIIEQTEKDYRASWYGREVHPEIEPARDIEYRDWWGHWATASMCEYLKQQGRSVQVV